MFGPKSWDVTGEFVGDCQTLDMLIKELLADGFAEESSSGWHSPAAKTHSCIHIAPRRLISLTVHLLLGAFIVFAGKTNKQQERCSSFVYVLISTMIHNGCDKNFGHIFTLTTFSM